jgi:hypothetical protein
MVVPVGVIKRATAAMAVVAWTTMVAVEASTTTVASFDLRVDGVVVFFCVKLTGCSDNFDKTMTHLLIQSKDVNIHFYEFLLKALICAASLKPRACFLFWYFYPQKMW